MDFCDGVGGCVGDILLHVIDFSANVTQSEREPCCLSSRLKYDFANL